MEDTAVAEQPRDPGQAKIVYIIYLVSILFTVLGIVGVVMAYVNKGKAPDWLQTHYQFQIRTFWIGALYIFLGILFSPLVIGYFILLFWLIWLIVRSVKGMSALENKIEHPKPKTWMF